MNFLGFGQSAEIDIVFDGADTRKMVEVKTEEGKKEKMYLYYDGETVKGKVNVTLKKPGSKLEHQGIKIELIGQIELFYDRGNHHEFTSLFKELARPGDLIQNTSYPFEFANVEKPFEVYGGANVRLRYFLRVTIIRRLSDIVREVDIAVHTLCSYPDLNNPIKMEVGIEDCLHIEFEYNKSKYHLKDVIVGKIYFLLVRIKIKHMEIAIIKRESTGTGPNVFTENDTIAKYEIMDGAPVKGESIPIRVFLAGYDLTPTMREINKKFSVKYFLNLVLMDTEDRRYFKQQEITLWRKSEKGRKSQAQLANNPHVPTHLVGGADNMSSSSAAVKAAVAAAAAAAAAAANSKSPLEDAGAEQKSGATTVDPLEAGAEGAADDGDGTSSPRAEGHRFGTDHSVGLFVRDNSPQPNDDHDASKLTAATNPPLSLPAADSSTGGDDFQQRQRGIADGAPVQSDEPGGATASGGTLFDTIAEDQSKKSSTTPAPTPAARTSLQTLSDEPPPIDDVDDNNDGAFGGAAAATSTAGSTNKTNSASSSSSSSTVAGKTSAQAALAE